MRNYAIVVSYEMWMFNADIWQISCVHAKPSKGMQESLGSIYKTRRVINTLVSPDMRNLEVNDVVYCSGSQSREKKELRAYRKQMHQYLNRCQSIHRSRPLRSYRRR